jgi:hypothetical protein
MQPDAILQWIQQKKKTKSVHFSEKRAMVTLLMIRQVYTLRTKRARQVKTKVKSMLFIFFGIKGIIHKEFGLSGQTVNSTY